MVEIEVDVSAVTNDADTDADADDGCNYAEGNVHELLDVL